MYMNNLPIEIQSKIIGYLEFEEIKKILDGSIYNPNEPIIRYHIGESMETYIVKCQYLYDICNTIQRYNTTYPKIIIDDEINYYNCVEINKKVNKYYSGINAPNVYNI